MKLRGAGSGALEDQGLNADVTPNGGSKPQAADPQGTLKGEGSLQQSLHFYISFSRRLPLYQSVHRIASGKWSTTTTSSKSRTLHGTQLPKSFIIRVPVAIVLKSPSRNCEMEKKSLSVQVAV